MTRKPHALNVIGPFYVEDGCCTMCGVPIEYGRGLFGEVAELCDGEADVPSPIDLRDREVALAWANDADAKRPWRREVRQLIAGVIRDELSEPRRILELGSGPGLLAQAILEACPVASYTLFDFSPPFLAMCRERLGANPNVHYVAGDFTRPEWPSSVAPPFDAVVAMQAVHEVRHKRHVPALYAQILPLLRPGGVLLVCDHEPPHDSPRMTALHSTEQDQHAALRAAGFTGVVTRGQVRGLYLCSGRR